MAIANLRAGSLDDAMDAIEEAIKIRSRSLGRDHPRVAVCMQVYSQFSEILFKSCANRALVFLLVLLSSHFPLAVSQKPLNLPGFIGGTRNHSAFDG